MAVCIMRLNTGRWPTPDTIDEVTESYGQRIPRSSPSGYGRINNCAVKQTPTSDTVNLAALGPINSRNTARVDEHMALTSSIANQLRLK